LATRSALRRLADRAGILASYRPMAGAPPRHTTDATREALLSAMGFDASSEASARRTLAALEARDGARPLAPVRVVPAGSPAARRLAVRLPDAAGPRIEWLLTLGLESGQSIEREGSSSPRRGRAHLALPLPDVPPGYHELRVVARWRGGEIEARQRLVACPTRCASVEDVLARRRGYGWIAHLYGLRSAPNWGVGDLADLAELARLAGRAGAAFVGVNPLHALWNRGWDVSPYSPMSRLYRNEIYLRIEAIPELEACPDARAQLADPRVRAAVERLRASPAVDYDGVRAAKRALLEPLHRTFAERHRDRDTPRGRAYRSFADQGGRALEDFATFVALAEHRGESDWRRWPAELRDPRSAAVARFRAERAEAVSLHRWIQFELDRQLAEAARAGREAGLSIGLFGDLAVGTAPSGHDPWAFGPLFARGVTIGAPPDDFSSTGQDWALPPIVPERLREDGYGYWIQLLRAGFGHVGMLRLDHVMGLLRLWWIPEGRPPTDGAYVAYPARDLFGILALESRRSGALVVGEDLGTVPRGLGATLERWGVLSTRVLYFERRGTRWRSAPQYSRRALVTPSTHDLPPLAGFAACTDLELRSDVGQIRDAAALAAARRERADACRGLARRLAAELRGRNRPALPRDPAQLVPAVVRFLAHTPAPLLGLPLDDLVGEAAPVNLPGVPQQRFPSWTRKLSVPLEALADHPTLRAALSALPRARRTRGGIA